MSTLTGEIRPSRRCKRDHTELLYNDDDDSDKRNRDGSSAVSSDDLSVDESYHKPIKAKALNLKITKPVRPARLKLLKKTTVGRNTTPGKTTFGIHTCTVADTLKNDDIKPVVEKSLTKSRKPAKGKQSSKLSAADENDGDVDVEPVAEKSQTKSRNTTNKGMQLNKFTAAEKLEIVRDYLQMKKKHTQPRDIDGGIAKYIAKKYSVFGRSLNVRTLWSWWKQYREAHNDNDVNDNNSGDNNNVVVRVFADESRIFTDQRYKNMRPGHLCEEMLNECRRIIREAQAAGCDIRVVPLKKRLQSALEEYRANGEHVACCRNITGEVCHRIISNMQKDDEENSGGNPDVVPVDSNDDSTSNIMPAASKSIKFSSRRSACCSSIYERVRSMIIEDNNDDAVASNRALDANVALIQKHVREVLADLKSGGEHLLCCMEPDRFSWKNAYDVRMRWRVEHENQTKINTDNVEKSKTKKAKPDLAAAKGVTNKNMPKQQKSRQQPMNTTESITALPTPSVTTISSCFNLLHRVSIAANDCTNFELIVEQETLLPQAVKAILLAKLQPLQAELQTFAVSTVPGSAPLARNVLDSFMLGNSVFMPMADLLNLVSQLKQSSEAMSSMNRVPAIAATVGVQHALTLMGIILRACANEN